MNNSFVVVLGLIGVVLAQPAGAVCDCDAVVEMAVGCDQEAWDGYQHPAVTSYSELGELLEALIEMPASHQCAMESEFMTTVPCDVALLQQLPNSDQLPNEDTWQKYLEAQACVEQCIGPCREMLMEAYYQMILESPPGPRLWGAIAKVYATYMDIEASDEWLERMKVSTSHVFEKYAADPTTLAVTLKMSEFHDLRSQEVMNGLVELMSHSDRLVRGMSLGLFYRYTGCPLMKEWPRDEEPTPEQVESVRNWWKNSSQHE